MQRQPRSSSTGLAVALTVLGGLALLAGCGGGEEQGARPGGAGPSLGAEINLADCADWNGGSAEERLGTIRKLRDFTGGPVAGTAGRGGVLDDEDAYDLFERWCARDFARGFKLYKLYGRAAGFAGE